MSPLEIGMLVTSSATLLGYILTRAFSLQPTIGILSTSLLLVTVAHGIESFLPNPQIIEQGITFIANTQFNHLVLDVMLPILLFAGAMSMNVQHFKKHATTILTLATFSTITSTFLIGYGLYLGLLMLNMEIPYIYCLIFGALISPTDPVAVVALVKKSKLSKDIEAKIAGESLFNDGVGIVLFLTLCHVAFDQQPISFFSISLSFLREAIGGSMIGVFSGYLCRQLVSFESTFRHNHIIISIFIVTGVYTLTNALGMSGALAVVISGLFMADLRSEHPSQYSDLQHFWESLEEVLNMVLYLLIGLEAFLLPPTYTTLVIALMAILLTLLSRGLTVAGPIQLLSRHQPFEPKTKRLLIWGGLRGGLAVALTLSLPDIPERELLLIATYAVVCFSTIIQGGSIARLIKSDS